MHFDGRRRAAFNDPRRFGSFMLTTTPGAHPLLKELGPEPLGAEFDADYLWRASRNRRVAIKQHLMNGKRRRRRRQHLCERSAVPRRYSIRGEPRPNLARALRAARRARARRATTTRIEEGGTTLRNFVGGDGKPGYFRQSLNV